MATAFSSREREVITQKLKEAALHAAATTGLRHATVASLARQAGISKGAFYSFYESKEHLFLAMLEDIHDEMYGKAETILKENAHLPPQQRAMLAVKQVCGAMMKADIQPFIQGELPLMLRRLPEKLVARHYHSDEEHIRRLVAYAGVHLKTDIDTACAAIRLLVMSLMLKDSIGPGFAGAWEAAIDGVCKELVE